MREIVTVRFLLEEEERRDVLAEIITKLKEGTNLSKQVQEHELVEGREREERRNIGVHNYREGGKEERNKGRRDQIFSLTHKPLNILTIVKIDYYLTANKNLSQRFIINTVS